MYHSLTISGKNTYTELGLLPASRPVIKMPEVKTNYQDLPASHGVLDYTEALLGLPPYGQREGSWEFYLRPGRAWPEVYSSLANFLHGRRHTVILEDDPGYQYAGRLSINDWKSEGNNAFLVIDYNLDPFKSSLIASDDADWLWNDLFDITIKYGTFNVDGEKYRNFVYYGVQDSIPSFTCSATMTVERNGETYTLVKGLNDRNANLALRNGDNIMIFRGTGTVRVSYREVSL